MFDSLENLSFLPLFLAVGTAPFLIQYGRKVVELQVSERTRELETLHENQRRLLLELSHNIQTPLSVLKGRIERFERNLLHDGPADGPGLGQSVDALSGFISELLSLAHLDHSLAQEERKQFSLSALVASIVEEIQIVAQPKGIGITSALCPDIAFFGNEKRMREAVMNLACNAVKYMGEGPVRRIRISLRIKGGQTLIEIMDTGRGIPEHELSRIFERFYRGRGRAYGEVPGTGLGLAIVERIVQEHGGAVTVTSEVDRGSTFTIVLPNSPANTQARSKRNHT